MKGLAELEKCVKIRAGSEILSERQEILKGMVEDKIRLQSRATDKYYEQIFEEVKELEEKNQKRLCHLCRKSTMCGNFRLKEMKQEDCKDLEAREG